MTGVGLSLEEVGGRFQWTDGDAGQKHNSNFNFSPEAVCGFPHSFS